MKTQLLTLITALILIVSCKQKETVKIEKENNIEKNVIAESYIENDSLLTLLKSDLYNISFKPIFEGAEIPTNTTNYINPHINKSIVFEQSKIHMYRDGFSEKIIAAEIKNSTFKFLDSIYIGITKEKFESRIKTELKSNLIKIGNLEQTSVFIFKFENEILKVIEYVGYMD